MTLIQFPSTYCHRLYFLSKSHLFWSIVVYHSMRERGHAPADERRRRRRHRGPGPCRRGQRGRRRVGVGRRRPLRRRRGGRRGGGGGGGQRARGRRLGRRRRRRRLGRIVEGGVSAARARDGEDGEAAGGGGGGRTSDGRARGVQRGSPANIISRSTFSNAKAGRRVSPLSDHESTPFSWNA